MPTGRIKPLNPPKIPINTNIQKPPTQDTQRSQTKSDPSTLPTREMKKLSYTKNVPPLNMK
jgi:hypothetical protein